MKSAAEILVDLVAIPSVSSMSNRAVIEYAIQYLDRSDWLTNMHCYHDGTGTEKLNLVATAKQNSSEIAQLALVCHTDTVPFDPAWQGARFNEPHTYS